jgi:hypothetical protein
MATRRARSRSDFPPNPAQWPFERNGRKFRQRFSIPFDQPLRPFEIGGRFSDVTLLSRDDLAAMVEAEDLAEAFGPARHRWSAVTIPIPGNGFVIIMNDTHARTRQNATLMEEYFHIVLGHKPSRIKQCPLTGLMKREFNKKMENEAYWSAAAALVPFTALRDMVDAGLSVGQIAGHFEVSDALVEFRLKVTKQWRRSVASSN